MHALLKQLPRRLRTRAASWAARSWMTALAAAALLTLGRRSAMQLLQPEFLLYLAILLGVAMLPAVRRFVSSLPKQHRWGYGLLLTVLLTGQMAGEDRGLFPLVRWDMYSRPLDPQRIVIPRYVGVTAKGQRVLLNPSTLFPSVGSGTLRLHNRMELLAKAVINPARGPHAAEIEARLQSMLHALATKHNHSAPAGQGVTSVELWQGDLNLSRSTTPGWKCVYQMEVSGHAIATLRRPAGLP